ncbi:metallophosphoesterase family protein [Pelagibacterium xiamenense]|uniref:metallophosphoesterase family protein n=1 Tax=Pelagibacterium xiamenense TaxID=2901140 RepID=UPI001E326FA7|nr:metallophosphoesterase [Pelagibacterium xiamenense]MCD7060328.1 metallophosphoesterase [Pelagibacterium xiamenense]
MITLAHISDVHLSPLPRVHPRELMSKRITGYLNWKLNRAHHMRRDTLSALVSHMKNQAPDMIAVTGDLVNLGLDDEIDRAANWLAALGGPDAVCAIPGNHDAYVKGALETALKHYNGYMSGETLDTNPFPYVRRLGNVALIGVSSAIATPPLIAAGQVGQGQIGRLARLLELLGEAGFFRVVMIHHPPSEALGRHKRKGLWDAPAVRSVISKHGAELILHGHTHISSVGAIPAPAGEIPVVGVASAAAPPDDNGAPGRYNLFEIEKVGSMWTCTMREFGYQRIGDDIALRLQMRIH